MTMTKTLDTCPHADSGGCDPQLDKAGKVDEIEAAACVCDAEGARWRKKAQKHLPHHNSDHARRDIERAEICEKLAKKIREIGKIIADPI